MAAFILIGLPTLAASARAEETGVTEAAVSDSVDSDDEVWDPIEPVNRGIFWFNDRLDRNLLEPIAEGYDYIFPGFVKKGVKNFFINLRYPQYLLSDLIQFKFDQAGVHTGRFILNTTLGVGGLNDIAENTFGLEHHYEDFGTALGYHGVGEGPYLMLPLLGPSNVRDTIGEVVDGAVNPVAILGYTDLDEDTVFAVDAGLRVLNIVNTRARLIEAVKTARESSVDYYLFVRSAFHQRRQGDIFDGAPPDGFSTTHSGPVGGAPAK